MHALLISTYEMGRQPFGLASPAAWLRAAGWDVTCVDAAKTPLTDDAIQTADLIAVHLPMHTATRLAAPVIVRARQLNRAARIGAYGLYAPLNGEWLRSLGVDRVFGGEFEDALTRWAGGASGAGEAGEAGEAGRACQTVPRVHFLVPDRSGLPPLDRYATLHMPDGRRQLVGYTEASRGCGHLCRHCPVVPIYHGQFRIVPADVVLADIAAQVASGARHITFGDPDFFNGPTHAMRVIDGLHAAHPDVTYDVTIKVEHLLQKRELLPRLRDTGCAFVTTAVESIDDRVLAVLEKGHTRADFVEAVALCRRGGVTLVPTFVAFHPWLSLEGYCDLLDTIDSLDLIDHVAPIQLSIRLLITQASRLLELDEIRRLVSQFDASTLTYRWSHQDHAVDALQRDVAALVGMRVTSDRRAIFAEVRALARARAGLAPLSRDADSRPARARATVPYLNEPWYC